MIEITVGIPVYNVEKYIRKSLTSVLDQDFDKSVEVLVIDDCGSDKSIQIVKEICREHPKGSIVEIIHHESNKGLGPARNTALEHARGKYIFFLDSDDWISVDCLSVLYNQAIKENADFVVGSVCRIEEDTSRIISNSSYQYITVNKKGAGAYMSFNDHDFHIEVWNKLFLTDFLIKNKIRFVHRIFEDYYFDFRLRAASTKIVLCSNITLFYNIRQNSILTQLKVNQGTDESIITFCEIIHYLQEMLCNEYTGINYINDLYFLRLIWIFENMDRYKYNPGQIQYMRAHLSNFVSCVPTINCLKSSRNRFIYLCCLGNDNFKSFRFFNRVSKYNFSFIFNKIKNLYTKL